MHGVDITTECLLGGGVLLVKLRIELARLLISLESCHDLEVQILLLLAVLPALA